jgi:uncharacterized protein YdhG (YjbR/CyaY superfamily)
MAHCAARKQCISRFEATDFDMLILAAASPILKGAGAILNALASGKCKKIIFTFVKNVAAHFAPDEQCISRFEATDLEIFTLSAAPSSLKGAGAILSALASGKCKKIFFTGAKNVAAHFVPNEQCISRFEATDLEIFILCAASRILKGAGAILSALASGECKHVIFTP